MYLRRPFDKTESSSGVCVVKSSEKNRIKFGAERYLIIFAPRLKTAVLTQRFTVKKNEKYFKLFWLIK